MEINYIHQDQFREEIDKKAKLRRIERVERTGKVKKVEDSEKDKEDRKKYSSATEVVIKQKIEENSSATIELTEKASKIADRYEAQKHMEGQHSGNIEKLRSKLNNVSDKEAIEEVKQDVRKKQKAVEAYEKSSKDKKTKQTTFEEER